MGEKVSKKVIVISAINFFQAGPLSVLKDNLRFVNTFLSNEYRIIALVHNKELFKLDNFNNIFLMEFPKSKGNYIVRLYLEFIYFNKLSLKLNPYLWFSLHDITPNVHSKIRVVYCHNPTPFRNLSITDLYFQPTIFLFSLFYKILYKINIKKNNYVVLQQKWIKKEFIKMFNLAEENVLVCYPHREAKENLIIDNKVSRPITFFYPALARPFKNFEVIGEAVRILEKNNVTGFQVIITILGNENNYARYVFNKYGYLKNLHFVGLLSSDKVEEMYQQSDAMIFSSTLETWGLPITEFKAYNKPIILSNLNYAHETIGGYPKTCFFDPYDPKCLSEKMQAFISGSLDFDLTSESREGVLVGWASLYTRILKG